MSRAPWDNTVTFKKPAKPLGFADETKNFPAYLHSTIAQAHSFRHAYCHWPRPALLPANDGRVFFPRQSGTEHDALVAARSKFTIAELRQNNRYDDTTHHCA
jgi:hypothetical protein